MYKGWFLWIFFSFVLFPWFTQADSGKQSTLDRLWKARAIQAKERLGQLKVKSNLKGLSPLESCEQKMEIAFSVAGMPGLEVISNNSNIYSLVFAHEKGQTTKLMVLYLKDSTMEYPTAVVVDSLVNGWSAVMFQKDNIINLQTAGCRIKIPVADPLNSVAEMNK